MLTKYAAAATLSVEWVEDHGSSPARDTKVRTFKQAHRATFQYERRPGYLYVRSRAISSRCNDNYDEFPAEEIKLGYRTFVGKPVFVNHKNDDHRRARGVVIDAALHEDTNPDGSPDTWCEVLMEVDAVRFPKLAQAILAGEVDRTSMGTDVAYSKCSFCGNKAATPLEYCNHIPKLKGKRIRRTTASGAKEDVLVREICYGLSFFENSLLVEEPADPTAYFLGVDGEGVTATAGVVTEAMLREAMAKGGIGKTAERVGYRYSCSLNMGISCDSGRGKPTRKKCSYCGAALNVWPVLWGIFEWTGDGRYPEEKAVKTFANYDQAERAADQMNEGVATSQGGFVVRDIPKGSPTRSAVKYPALGHSESIDINVRPGDEPRIEAMLPFMRYGPDYVRGIVSALQDYSLFVGRGNDEAADIYLEQAESAMKSVLERRQGSLVKEARICGEFDPADYSPNECPAWNPHYYAAWLKPEGKVLAVTSHDDAPGKQAGAFSSGWVRLAISDYPTRPILQAEAHRWPWTPQQVGAFAKLTQEFGVSRPSIIQIAEASEGNGTYVVPPAETSKFLRSATPVDPASGRPAGGRGSVNDFYERFSVRHGSRAVCPGCGVGGSVEQALAARGQCRCGTAIYLADEQGEPSLRLVAMAPEWTEEDEAKHPRKGDGKFAPKGQGESGGGGGSASQTPSSSDKPRVPPNLTTKPSPEQPVPKTKKGPHGIPRKGPVGVPKSDQPFSKRKADEYQPKRLNKEERKKYPVGSRENPIATDDPSIAAEALWRGEWVELARPEEVAVLADKLSELKDWAKAQNVKDKEEWEKAGKDPKEYQASAFNLCRLQVPGTNLFCDQSKGIPRVQMPQLKANNPLPGSKAEKMPRDENGEVDLNGLFKEALIAKGIKVKSTDKHGKPLKIPAMKLKSTQNELQGEKIGFFLNGLRKNGPEWITGSVFISKDGYIVDGHHRWAGLVAYDLENGKAGEIDMEVERIDLDIITILRMANDFCAEYGLPSQDAQTFAGRNEEKAARLMAQFPKLSYAETKAPADVDTLRDAECPVCGEEQSYDGETCLVCGFIKPPEMFMDPDLEKAQEVDLRQQEDDIGQPGGEQLSCDQCGAKFPKSPEAPGAPAPEPGGASKPQPDPAEPHTHPGEDHPDAQHPAEAHPDKPHPHDPEAEDKPAPGEKVEVEVDDGKDDDDEELDEDGKPKKKKKPPFIKGSAAATQTEDKPHLQAPSLPHVTDKEQVGQDAAEGEDMPDTAPQAGDTCPECGKGTLRPDTPAATKQKEVPPGKPGDGAEEEKKKDAPPWAKDEKSKGKEQKESSATRSWAATQKEQSMRPALAALAEQQQVIDHQARQIQALKQAVKGIARLAGVDEHPKFAALMKIADENNPVQPVPDPPSEAPSETTEQALAPEGKDDPTTIGASPVTDVAADATTDVLTTDVVLDEPLDLNEKNVQAPVAGTEGPRPLDEVKTETEIRIGDPNNPDTMFPLQGPFAEKATTGSREGRTIASMRLARLRIQAGIANGDDLTMATAIAGSTVSDEVIQAEIDTLSQVMRTASRAPQGARNLVPRSASRQRSAPSLSEPFAVPEIQVVSAVEDSEILFE